MLDVGVSDEMKTAEKIPIPKKSKDQKDMNNYRGILISSSLCKVFESLILKKTAPSHSLFSSLDSHWLVTPHGSYMSY